MGALSANRTTASSRNGATRQATILSGATVYKGSLCQLDSNGYLIPLANATAGQFFGVCYGFSGSGYTLPTSASTGATGNAGHTIDALCTSKGCYSFAIASATIADLGKLAYGIDDGTVQSSTVGNAFIVGKIVAILSSTSVLVDMEDRVL